MEQEIVQGNSRKAVSPPLLADPLITAADNRSTVFARWHLCPRPSNTRFFGPTVLIIPSGSSIDSAVFARSMAHSVHMLHRAVHAYLPKIVLYREEAGPHLTHGSFEPPNPPSQTAPRSIQPFFHNSWSYSLPTDRPTDRKKKYGTPPIRIGRLS